MEDNKPQGREALTNSGPVNPAKYYAKWSSENKCFVFYDKAKKEDVLVPLPYTFIPIAQAVCVRGYHEPSKTTYISNEIHRDNIKTDIFVIRAYNTLTKKSHVAFKGTWEEINATIKAVSCKWTESVYVAVRDKKDSPLYIANIQLSGSGMTHWFEFLKENDISKVGVQVKEFSNEKKGSNKYVAPIFSAIKIKPETDIEAAGLQKEINAFLNQYYERNRKENGSVSVGSAAQSESKSNDSGSPFKGAPEGAKVSETTSDIHFGDPDAPDDF